MNKFKVGDKVRCVHPRNSQITFGGVYTVINISPNNYWYRVVNNHGVIEGYTADTFELIPTNTVITPEEVFEHLRKGTKLQHFHGTHGWKDVTTPNELYYEDICNEIFRVKPEPAIITLNGKRYQALED